MRAREPATGMCKQSMRALRRHDDVARRTPDGGARDLGGNEGRHAGAAVVVGRCTCMKFVACCQMVAGSFWKPSTVVQCSLSL